MRFDLRSFLVCGIRRDSTWGLGTGGGGWDWPHAANTRLGEGEKINCRRQMTDANCRRKFKQFSRSSCHFADMHREFIYHSRVHSIGIKLLKLRSMNWNVLWHCDLNFQNPLSHFKHAWLLSLPSLTHTHNLNPLSFSLSHTHTHTHTHFETYTQTHSDPDTTVSSPSLPFTHTHTHILESLG